MVVVVHPRHDQFTAEGALFSRVYKGQIHRFIPNVMTDYLADYQSTKKKKSYEIPRLIQLSFVNWKLISENFGNWPGVTGVDCLVSMGGEVNTPCKTFLIKHYLQLLEPNQYIGFGWFWPITDILLSLFTAVSQMSDCSFKVLSIRVHAGYKQRTSWHINEKMGLFVRRKHPFSSKRQCI